MNSKNSSSGLDDPRYRDETSHMVKLATSDMVIRGTKTEERTSDTGGRPELYKTDLVAIIWLLHSIPFLGFTLVLAPQLVMFLPFIITLFHLWTSYSLFQGKRRVSYLVIIVAGIYTALALTTQMFGLVVIEGIVILLLIRTLYRAN